MRSSHSNLAALAVLVTYASEIPVPRAGYNMSLDSLLRTTTYSSKGPFLRYLSFLQKVFMCAVHECSSIGAKSGQYDKVCWRLVYVVSPLYLELIALGALGTSGKKITA